MKRRTFMAHVSAAAGGAAAYALTPGFPAILSAQSTGPGPVVETTSGRVRGSVDSGVNVFKGIPYGAQRRFMAPVKAAQQRVPDRPRSERGRTARLGNALHRPELLGNLTPFAAIDRAHGTMASSSSCRALR
jgi:hypothetical protein